MGKNIEIYLKNIVRRWKMEARSSDKLLIFSPYITSTTAETVTSEISHEECEIYTMFSSELFINQSSSIRTLVKLKEKGFRLYSLPNLHAKIFLSPGSFVSIGSQNLTTRGSRNLEATVFLSAEKEVAKVHRKIQLWIKQRREISLNMLAQMEELVRPHIKAYKSIISHSDEIDSKVMESEKLRVLEGNKLLGNTRTRNMPKKFIKRSLVAEVCGVFVEGRVRKIPANNYSGGTYSFIPDGRHDLTRWIVNDTINKLERTNRYIILIEDTGKIGFVRVMKTRLTYFARGVYRTETVTFGMFRCNIEYKAIWDEDELLKENIRILIRPKASNSYIECAFRLYLDEFILNRKTAIENENGSDLIVRVLMKWIDDNSDEFISKILDGLLSPFKYERNLSGTEADEFFGFIGERYEIRLAIINNMPLLLANSL